MPRRVGVRAAVLSRRRTNASATPVLKHGGGSEEVVVAAQQLVAGHRGAPTSRRARREQVRSAFSARRQLYLLGEFVILDDGTTISVPTNVERLVAFLAIH